MFEYKIDNEISLAIPRPKVDAESIFKLIDASRNELGTWLSWVNEIQNIADEEKALVRDLEKFGKRTSVTTIIMFREQPVGAISLNRFHDLNNSTEIGYWLGTNFNGHGIMHRAVIGMCELGFNDYQVNKIEILTAIDNQQSNNVAKKAGFHLDGTIRANELLADGYHDGYIWTLLRDEWQAKVHLQQ